MAVNTIGVDTLDLEKAIIGELWLDTRNIYMAHLSEDVFRCLDTRMLFGVLRRYPQRNDIFGLKAALDAEHHEQAAEVVKQLFECEGKAVSVTMLPDHMRQLKDIHRRDTITQIVQNAEGNITSDDIERIHKLTRPDTLKSYEVNTLKELSLGFGEEYQKRRDLYSNGVPYPTGYKKLDERIGGFPIGNVTLVGGRTSYGKTALMTNMAVNVSSAGVKTLYLSCEMESYDLFDRIIAARCAIESYKIRFGRLSEQDLTEVNEGLGKGMFYENPLMIAYTPGLTVDAVAQLVEDYQPKIVFIDHFQIMRIKGERGMSRAQAMEEAVYELKNTAAELGVGYVVGSQISRDAVKNPPAQKLTPAYYKGSGGLEDCAAVAIEIKLAEGEQKEAPEWLMDIEVQKARFGPVGTVQMRFMRQYSKFVEV